MIKRTLTAAIGMAALAACSTIALFSQTAYTQATSIKATAMTVMSEANEDYAKHKTEVDGLRLDVEKAYEYAKGRPRNEISTKQWEIVRDPKRNSLVGFCVRWAHDGTLNAAFIDESKKVIADDLDQIIGLESGKIKPGAVTTGGQQ
jgi:hypothetical protein